MPYLLHPTDIARIRIQAEFENIYDNGFIGNTTDDELANNLSTFKTKLKKLFNGIDQLSRLYTTCSIGLILSTEFTVLLQGLTKELLEANNELKK